MYRKILVPVDLAHLDGLERSIDTATDLAKHYGASLHFVGITTTTPSEVAHTPEEYSRKLHEYAERQGAAHGLSASSIARTSHDPAVDLSHQLLEAIGDAGADLVVMASHVPGLADHVFASHGGAVAAHARVSVLLVR
ncbi:MAG: universal stress protein [Tistlia sp.]|uniref:universal stress protein n=1 Tax=Tistlia sp. TaxID=3057121 RepID=UPI0034A2682B